MIVVDVARIDELVRREKRVRPAMGRTLERRVRAWKAEVERAHWRHAKNVKDVFGSADPIGGNRIVFDVCGNSYRFVVHVNYAEGVVRVRFAGTHGEYDDIDALTV